MELTIRKGGRGDLPAYLSLLQDVRASMDHPEWFYLDPPEEVRAMLEAGAMELWVALDGERLAAGFDLIRPGLESYNYGYDLDFTEEELLRVVNMDTAAVHPDYRGHGLQSALIRQAEAKLRQEGNWILLCTVHPDNQFSLRNVLGQGYTIEKKLEKYGSVRYILRKDLV